MCIYCIYIYIVLSFNSAATENPIVVSLTILTIHYLQDFTITGHLFVLPMVDLKSEVGTGVTSHERHGVSNRLFTQQLFQAIINKNINVSYYRRFLRTMNQQPVHSRTKVPVRWKTFPLLDYAMISFACRVIQSFRIIHRAAFEESTLFCYELNIITALPRVAMRPLYSYLCNFSNQTYLQWQK